MISRYDVLMTMKSRLGTGWSRTALVMGFCLTVGGCSIQSASEDGEATAETEQALALSAPVFLSVPFGDGTSSGRGWVFYVEEDTTTGTIGFPTLETSDYRDIIQQELLEGWQSASKLEFYWMGSRLQPCVSDAECAWIGQTCSASALKCTTLAANGTCQTTQTAKYCKLQPKAGYIRVDVEVSPDVNSWCEIQSKPLVHMKEHRVGNGFSVSHEFGHAIGFTHEQGRVDNTDSSKAVLENTLNTAPDTKSHMWTYTGTSPENNPITFWDRVGVAARFGRRATDLSPMTTWCRVGTGGNCYGTGLPGLDYATIAANSQEGLLQGTTAYVPKFANGWLWDRQMPGTIPLNLYLNPTTGDYLTARDLTGLSSGYTQTVGTVGYIYSTQPATGAVALKLYQKGNDYLTTADTVAQAAALAAGYGEKRTEGYIFNTNLPYRILHHFARIEGQGTSAFFVHNMATAVGMPLQADLLEDALVPGGSSCSSERLCAPSDTGCVPRGAGYCPSWQTPYQSIGGSPIVLAYQVEGSIPFETYYNASEHNYFGCAASCATDAQKTALVNAGYKHMQTEGYVFATDQFGYSLDGKVSSSIPRSVTGDLSNGSVNTIEGYGLVNESFKGVRVASMVLDATAETDEYALYASNSLKLNDRAQVKASHGRSSILNTGSAFTHVGVEAKVDAVKSVASVDLGDRATVSGFVESEAAVAVGNSVTHSAIASNTRLDAPTLDWFTKDVVQFPATSKGDVYLEPNQASAKTTLAPGRYGTVMVKANTVLSLRSGKYYFDALYDEGKISIDTKNGPVRIYIVNTFIYTGSVVDKDLRFRGDLLIGYFGTAEVHINAAFVGTIVAPKAKLTLASVSAGFVGAFYARDIEVHQDSVVTHLPFLFSWLP